MALDIIPLKINEGDIVIIKCDMTDHVQLNKIANEMAKLFEGKNQVLIMPDNIDIKAVDEKYMNRLGYFKRSKITREVNVMGRKVDLPLTSV